MGQGIENLDAAVPRSGCGPAGRIRVEEQPEEESGSAKAVIRLDEDSQVVYREGRAAGPGELAVGQRVSAWFSGLVAESYPVQATAAVVVIEP